MNLTCESLKEVAGKLALVTACDQIRNGMFRLATPFQYPDGSHIDLFVGQGEDLPQEYIVTDLGQTTAYLLDMHLKPWTSGKRKQTLADICKTLDVHQVGGELQVRLEAGDSAALSSAMVRLAQACIRVADLIFTQRLRIQSAFRQDFEEFLDNADYPWEADLDLNGAFQNVVTMDFRVRGRTVQSLVQTLATANAAASHQVANEVFRKWYDLRDTPFRASHQFISVYDSTTDVFRHEDIQRLATLSTVFPFPAEQQELKEVLAA